MIADTSINLVDYYYGYYDDTIENQIMSWSGGLLYYDDVDDRLKDSAYPSIFDILTKFPFPSKLLKLIKPYMKTGLKVSCTNRIFNYSNFPMKFRVSAHFMFSNIYELHTDLPDIDLMNWMTSDALNHLSFEIFALFNIQEDSYSLVKYEIDDRMYSYVEGRPGYYLSDDLDELKQIALEKLNS